MASPPPLEVVVLNVGGRLFTTTRTTLMKYPDSMLGGMFRGSMMSSAECGGGYFIDRNPTHFGAILDYLRDGSLPLPDGRLERRQLRAEAKFFLLEELVAALDAAEAEAEAAQAAAAAGAAARAFVDQQRAELLRCAVGDVERQQAAVAAALPRQAAAEGELRELEARWRHWLGAIAAAQDHGWGFPNDVDWDNAQAELHALDPVIQRKAKEVEEARHTAREAQKRLEEAQLVRLCALGADLATAQAQLAAVMKARGS